jgi:hypothetical protein
VSAAPERVHAPPMPHDPQIAASRPSNRAPVWTAGVDGRVELGLVANGQDGKCPPHTSAEPPTRPVIDGRIPIHLIVGFDVVDVVIPLEVGFQKGWSLSPSAGRGPSPITG